MIIVGRTVFVDMKTGAVLFNTGEIQTTNPDFESQIDYYATITALSERNKKDIKEYKFAIGDYEQDFNEGILDRIDIETGQLFFYYPDPDDSETPLDPQPALSKQIEALAQENTLLKAQSNALSERADFVEDVIAEMATQVYK